MKKIISIFTVIMILIFSFSESIYASEINFTDVKTTDWYYNNLQELVQKNIAFGYPDGTFKPNNTLKFEEFIKMLVVAVENNTTEPELGKEWYEIYIDSAFESKYITEQQKTLIGQNISRGTMADILYNALVEKENIQAYTNEGLEYLASRLTDVNKEDIKTLTINGIGVISGYPDKTFKIKGNLTRAEAIAVISRVMNPELRNPVKIVLRDENGVIDAKDLDKMSVDKAEYDINGQVQYSLNAEDNYKAKNIIKVTPSMFPIKYGGLVITGIEKLPAEKAPYYGDTSIMWGGADELDAIVIHAYPIEKSDDNKNTTSYWLDSALNVGFVDKSKNSYIASVIKVVTSYGGEAVYNKTNVMFPDYALGEYPKLELNQQFTTMAFTNNEIHKSFRLNNLNKIILMDTRGDYYPEVSTNDILEIDANYIKEAK